MKTRFLICSIVVLSLSMFIASAALAECRPGKIEVTIVTPAGKVIVICVPEHAVDQIGGPGDVVIPATCPCFSLEEVELAISNDPYACGQRGVGISDGEPCRTLIYVYADQVEFWVKRPSSSENPCVIQELYELPGGYCIPLIICKMLWNEGSCWGPNDHSCDKTHTDDELRACEAILMSLAWELYYVQ